ncbi:hypothetical protein WR25_03054 [Diploscapter pachys]|uniref:Uncharacterized protein n=1 Tax=Diploscapter pachys TaxID=2018661 RepID=A0A2A2KBE8_9BILA|nr:hypothetical protein WR25_03054 [Diploscapter pachys]
MISKFFIFEISVSNSIVSLLGILKFRAMSPKADNESVDFSDMALPYFKELYCIKWTTGDKKGKVECQFPEIYRQVNQLYKSEAALVFTCFEIVILTVFWILTRRLRGDFLKPTVTVLYIPLTLATICKLTIIYLKINEPYAIKGYWDGGFVMLYQFFMTTTHLTISMSIVGIILTVAFAARRRVGYDQLEMWEMSFAILFLSLILAGMNDFVSYNWRQVAIYLVFLIEAFGLMFLFVGVLIILCTFCCCSNHWLLREYARSHFDPVIFDARTRLIWTIPFVIFIFGPVTSQLCNLNLSVMPPLYFRDMGLYYHGLFMIFAFFFLTPYRMTLLELLCFDGQEYFPKKRTTVVAPERLNPAQHMGYGKPQEPELRMLMPPPQCNPYPADNFYDQRKPPQCQHSYNQPLLMPNQVSIGGHIIDLPSDMRATIEYIPPSYEKDKSSVIIEELPVEKVLATSKDAPEKSNFESQNQVSEQSVRINQEVRNQVPEQNDKIISTHQGQSRRIFTDRVQTGDSISVNPPNVVPEPDEIQKLETTKVEDQKSLDDRPPWKP